MKNSDMRLKFFVLKKGVQARFWNGKHPVEENSVVGFWPAGTTVRVVMCSRFGDVGITTDLVSEHGYNTRVNPEDLEEVKLPNEYY